MRQIWEFVKTTVLGGAIFLLPIAATSLIVVKAGKMAIDTAMPLADKLPLSKGEAVLVVYVVGAIALVLVSFAAGVFTRSVRIESKTASFLEDRILNRFPPYVAIRKLVDAFSDGHVAVFLPGAPDPSSGVVQIISLENISPINGSHGDVIACLEQSGHGLPNLLGRSFLDSRT